MTVKELKEKLNEYPDHLDVFIDERVSDFTYGLVNSVRGQDVNFVEEPGGEPLSRDFVVILSEE